MISELVFNCTSYRLRKRPRVPNLGFLTPVFSEIGILSVSLFSYWQSLPPGGRVLKKFRFFCVSGLKSLVDNGDFRYTLNQSICFPFGHRKPLASAFVIQVIFVMEFKMSVDPNQSELEDNSFDEMNSDGPSDAAPDVIEFDMSEPEFEVQFDENDFDHDFDDDFEEEVQGEYDMEDDQYGEEFNHEFGHLTADSDDEE